MIRIKLGVNDLANTRFGISPLAEAVRSLRDLSDPAQHTLHLPLLRSITARLDPADVLLLVSLVGPNRIAPDFRSTASRAIADFLTPVPTRLVERFDDQLAVIRATPLAVVRRDLVASYAPGPVPEVLDAAERSDARATRRLLNSICDALGRYWQVAFSAVWPQMRLVLEADTTYRARQLAVGGARLLFADLHPNVCWSDDGVLTVAEMIGDYTLVAAGRGLLLMPSIFAPMPVPPLHPDESPSLAYPSRGIGTLLTPPPEPEPSAIVDLLGRTRATLLYMLEEPLATVEIARRLRVTSSAVSQHLQVLLAAGLVTNARDRRQVLYRRTPLGDQLTTRRTES